MNEREVAIALRDGVIPSPVVFFNAMFVACRISGVGAAWRDQHQEFAWRDPAIWLTPEMCARWQGAPIIVQHPNDGLLDSDEFTTRVIGTIVLSFVRGDELWCVGRLLDRKIAELISQGGCDTSPAVVFSTDLPETKIVLPSGETLFVESDPVLCDHLAIVPEGVWSKGNGAAGIDTIATENQGVNA